MGRPKRLYPLGKFRHQVPKDFDKNAVYPIVLEYTWNREIKQNSDATINHALTPILKASAYASELKMIDHAVNARIQDMRITPKMSLADEESEFDGKYLTKGQMTMLLVGRPGLGKTPPLSFLYRPIHEQDDRMFERYLQACDEYERALAAADKNDSLLLKKPQLVTTVISDFTPEALMHVHQHNLRGVAIEVDEILAMFNSVKRYNSKNNLIEDLLSAYSGRPLKSVHKSEARPILIRQPCINVIGSVQTNLLPEIFRNEYKANGLFDRFLFVYPKDQRISKWQRTDRNTPRPDTLGQWRTIQNGILTNGRER